MSRDRRKRLGSSTAAVNARAVGCPTPGMLISRRHASDALTIRLMSPSLATMAASTAVRAATRPVSLPVGFCPLQPLFKAELKKFLLLQGARRRGGRAGG